MEEFAPVWFEPVLFGGWVLLAIAGDQFIDTRVWRLLQVLGGEHQLGMAANVLPPLQIGGAYLVATGTDGLSTAVLRSPWC